MRNVSLILVCSALLMLTGCQEIRRETSGILREKAIVISTNYASSESHLSLDLTYCLLLGIPLFTSTETVPEKFSVTFKCQHGEFMSDQKKTYEMYKDCQGKTIDIDYQEIYETTWDQGKQVTRIFLYYVHP